MSYIYENTQIDGALGQQKKQNLHTRVPVDGSNARVAEYIATLK